MRLQSSLQRNKQLSINANARVDSFINQPHNPKYKMTLLQRRTFLAGLPLLTLASLPLNALAQDKPASTAADKPGACNAKLGRQARNKANTGGKTNANQQCFLPGTRINQLGYDAAPEAAVFTDTIDWERCAYPQGVTITWLVHDTGTAKGSSSLWFNGSQINGSNHSFAGARKEAKQTRTFTQRLTASEAARGRVSLFAQGLAVVEFAVQAN